MEKKFWATVFTLSGTIIGAGILGLPYVFSKSGFFIGIFWIIAIGLVMLFVNLILAEITLRTKDYHQLSGYAEKYLGKKVKKLMFFSILFGFYSALLAYLVGEGESLSKLFSSNINPIIFGFLFWLIMTLLLREGLRGLKKVETWGVLIVVGMVIAFFLYFLPQININNFTEIDLSRFTLPFGITLFALMGFSSIPELRMEIKGKEKLFKKAVIIGSIIPVFLYILFCTFFIGVLGKNVHEVATLSFGPLITLLGIFTMTTSYFALSFALKDTFKYDLKLKENTSFFLVSILPLIFYVFVTKFNLLSFSRILSIGGTISGGISAILIFIIAIKAKKKTKNQKPEISMPLNWIIIIALSLIFISGTLAEFFI